KKKKKNVRRLYHDGQRTWILGKQSSLVSCDKGFNDWRLHFGGGGFVPHLELAGQVTGSTIAKEGNYFAIGTLQKGVGIYDLPTRQWIDTGIIPGGAAVNTLITTHGVNPGHDPGGLKNAGILWVGGKNGLKAYYVQRINRVLTVTRALRLNLPGWATTQPVKSLSIVNHSTLPNLQCITDRGGHREMDLQKNDWQEHVPGGDPNLTALDKIDTFTTIVPVTGGAWMKVENYPQVLYYDARTRSLAPRHDGLPEKDKITILQICKPPLSDRVRLLIRNDKDIPNRQEYPEESGNWIYLWNGKEWQPEHYENRIYNIHYLNNNLAARLADGSIKVYTTSPTTYFKPAPFDNASNLGKAAACQNQLFVEYFKQTKTGETTGLLARYIPGLRGWRKIPGYLDNPPLKELKATKNKLWMLTHDGKPGYLITLDSETPFYGTMYGTFEEYYQKVTTAASYRGKFWFVYGEDIYRYTSKGQEMRKVNSGVLDIYPLRLRTVGTTLYLLGHDGLIDWNKIFAFTREGWKEVPVNGSITAIEKVSNRMVCLMEKGEIRTGRPEEEGRLEWVPITINHGKKNRKLQFKRIFKDRKNKLWAKNGNRWYLYDSRNNSLTITTTTPQLKSPKVEGLPIKSGWRCKRRAGTRGRDRVTFILKGTGKILETPINRRRNWLDEYASTILPEKDYLLLGTEYGIRRHEYDSRREIMELPGVDIREIYRRNNSIYCRSSNGGRYLRHHNNTWQRINKAPRKSTAGAYLSITLGKTTISAARIKNNSTELLGFDHRKKRFNRDIVRELACDKKGLLVLTLGRGFQYLGIKKNRIHSRQINLLEHELADLRYGRRNTIFVKKKNGANRCWKFQATDTQVSCRAVDMENELNPYSVPLSGKITDLLYCQREFTGTGQRDIYRVRAWTPGAGKTIPLKKGKLAFDHILAVAGTGEKYWQATPVGIVENEKKEATLKPVKFIPYPQEPTPGEANIFKGISYYKKRLYCYDNTDTYMYNEKHR
ncbi:MAG: hypothetical protein GY757_33925, partial [bacterium]|nr:hypothetical protein [bacterium]